VTVMTVLMERSPAAVHTSLPCQQLQCEFQLNRIYLVNTQN